MLTARYRANGTAMARGLCRCRRHGQLVELMLRSESRHAGDATGTLPSPYQLGASEQGIPNTESSLTMDMLP